MREITKIAKKYSLAIIEDAADSLGSKYNNKHREHLEKLGCLVSMETKQLPQALEEP